MQLKHFTVEYKSFHSPALEDNPGGDPATRTIPVVVPRSVANGRGAPCPVLFLLAGFAGSAMSFVNWKSWTPSLPDRLDKLRDDGLIGDVIVVFPDAFNVYGGSQYLNSTASGRYEDMLVGDLVAWVDREYPTLASGRHRAIAGKSSGGFGALVLGMKHPDVFSAVACHSGDMYFEYVYKHDFPRLLRQLEKHGDLDGFMEAFFEAPKKTSELVLAMNVVAMAAAYSPAPDKPWRVDLPFDPRTGEIHERVWARWLAHDPVNLCREYAENLKKLSFLYLECGRRDQFHLQYGLRILVKRLHELGLTPHVEEFDDDHSDTSYRYETSLPLLWNHVQPDST